MKKTFHSFSIMVVALFAFITTQAQWTPIGNDNPAPAEVQLISSNIHESTIHFSLQGFNQVPLETPNGTEMKISVRGGVQIFEKGMPDLGKIVTNIIIPDTDEMQVTVVDAKYIDYQGIEIAPSKGHFDRNVNPDDVPFVYGEAYDHDAFWPGELAQLDHPFIMRDFRGQSVTVFPFQYNPVSQTLRVYTDITVEISSTGQKGVEPLYRNRDQIVIEREFSRVYDRFFLNKADASKSYPLLEGEEGSLLIIAYDAFMDEMQPFVDWKRTIGRKTEIVPKSEAGANANAIKNFVANYYDENDDFAYLLLVGDGPQIPPMTTSWGHSDNAYGFLVGSNSFNDIFVGRFSAENTAHVQTQVQRMIEYERDINETDTWLNVGMGVARNEGTGSGHYGENDYVHMDFIRDTLLNNTYEVIHRNYDGNVPGVPNTTAAQISANINSGVSTINFCNHGSVTGWSVAGYNISHVNQLTNVGKLPYVQSVACVNGNFVNNFCFAEAWLRATHDGQPTGAIGMMAATINQPWQPPMCGQDEMISIKTEESIPHGPTVKRTYGGISINGSMFMIPQHGAQGTRTHETWILFGDPTLMVRTDVPTAFEPDYPAVALIGWSSFEVTGLTDGAVAAFTVVNDDGDVEILGTAVAEGGVANIVFDEALNEPAIATLAITGFNKVTYINDDISVIPPSGPYILMKNIAVEGQTNFDETIAFTLEIENVGIHTAENLHVILSSDDNYVNIIEDTYIWGDLPEYETGVSENMFEVHLSKNIPDQHQPNFFLTFTDENEDSWYGNFSIKVDAPYYEVISLVVDDSETGNNNGNLDPGEIAHLHITVKNTGHAGIGELMASGTPQSEYLVFLDEYVYVGDIAVGEEKTIEITVMGSHLSLPETTEVFSLDLFKTDYLNENMIDIVVGILPEYHMGENNFAFDCYGKFYDSGGPDGNYGTNDDYIITFYPAYPDNQLHFVFDSFHIEESNNCQTTFFRVYDGPNTSWPMIGTFCSTNSPGEFTSTNHHGAITFRFKSGSGNTFPGWAARFYCTNPPLMFENISAYPQHINAGEESQLSAMATGGGDEITFSWTPAESLNDPNIPTPIAYPAETTEYTLQISDGDTTVEGSITIYVTPPDDTYDIIFYITDEHGDPVYDAVITLGNLVNEPGDYQFTDVEYGNHSWEISRNCYLTKEGSILANDDLIVELTLELDHLPGDANGDGEVDVLDLILMVNFSLDIEVDDICFYNADIDGNGIIDVLDIIATINLFTEGETSPHPDMESSTAYIYFDDQAAYLNSDGTLTGMQFELTADLRTDPLFESKLPDHELYYVNENGTIRVMIFSMDNKPIPEGITELLAFDNTIMSGQFIEGIAGNLNGDKVPLMLDEEMITSIDRYQSAEFNVYPNPARNLLYVESSETIRQIRLIDISGQLIKLIQADSMHAEINVSDLKSGIYFVEVQSESSTQTKRVQIIQ